jgi:acyl carrier protein
MDRKQITKEVHEFITGHLFGGNPPADFTNDTALISTRLLDSIVILNMISHLEETFKIEFEPHEINVDNLDTVNKTAELISQKLSK